MIVNNHVFGAPGAHGPAMQLRKLGAGTPFATMIRRMDSGLFALPAGVTSWARP